MKNLPCYNYKREGGMEMDKILRNRKVICLLLLPAVILFTCTVAVPLAWSFYYSMFNWNGVSKMKFTGLDNYIKLFSDQNFITSFKNNILFMIVNVIGQVGIALLVAILLTCIGKGRNLFKTIYFVPTILSAVALAQFFQKFYGLEPVGVLNALLEAVGLGDMQRAWLGDSATAMGSVIVIECYKSMPLYMVILYSGLLSIPDDVIDAARVDGAYGWKLFASIKLPYLYSVLTVTLVMAVNGLLKAFDVPFITTYGGPGRSTELVATYMYKVAFASTKYGYASTIAVFLVVESVLLVSVLRKFMSGRKNAV